MSLNDFIIEEIRSKGPISFHDFMELCLYHPEHGYYTSGSPKMGPRGDYYTSPALGPLFGALIANQLEEMWEIMGRKNFAVIEFGSGTGLLCNDILGAISSRESFNKMVHYYIVEKASSWSPQDCDPKVCDPKVRDLKIRDLKTLPSNITRVENLHQLKGLEGCILSNELVDNFSVHRVTRRKQLNEILVDYSDGEFRELLIPAGTELVDYFEELNVSLPEGFHTEVNLQATEWIKDVATILNKGFVMTIDYGFPSYELYTSGRADGNIMCYYQHRIQHSPYQHVGSQDITAHVNFSALHHWGSKYGLDLTGYTTQSKFLMGLGVSQQAAVDPACVASPMLLRTLLVDLGTRMKVLIQQKNLNRVSLSGLRFQQRL